MFILLLLLLLLEQLSPLVFLYYYISTNIVLFFIIYFIPISSLWTASDLLLCEKSVLSLSNSNGICVVCDDADADADGALQTSEPPIRHFDSISSHSEATPPQLLRHCQVRIIWFPASTLRFELGCFFRWRRWWPFATPPWCYCSPRWGLWFPLLFLVFRFILISERNENQSTYFSFLSVRVW